MVLVSIAESILWFPWSSLIQQLAALTSMCMCCVSTDVLPPSVPVWASARSTRRGSIRAESINKCHFLNAETPWECKQKVFPWMPFKLRAVCQLSRGRLIASAAAAAAAVVWCYLPRVFAFWLNFWWFKTKQNTAVRNKPFPSFALNLSGLLPRHTASNGRSVCLKAFCKSRQDLDNDVDRWKVFSQRVITPDYLFSQVS